MKGYSGLEETARIGKMGSFDVVVYTDDDVQIPHVHVIDLETRGRLFDASVCLTDNSYLHHEHGNDIFNAMQCLSFLEFMKCPHTNKHYSNNYEYAVNMWNDNNPTVQFRLCEDMADLIIIPDYSVIK